MRICFHFFSSSFSFRSLLSFPSKPPSSSYSFFRVRLRSHSPSLAAVPIPVPIAAVVLVQDLREACRPLRPFVNTPFSAHSPCVPHLSGTDPYSHPHSRRLSLTSARPCRDVVHVAYDALNTLKPPIGPEHAAVLPGFALRTKSAIPRQKSSKNENK